MASRDEGYTMVELLVVIVIFAIAMTIISVAFANIVSKSGKLVKAAETEIGGLIGLELMRVELGYAGFGLPWSLGDAYYTGEAESHRVNADPDTDAADFNDSSADGPPRAFVMQNDKAYNGSDYLVIKGTALGWNETSRGWSYINYSSAAKTIIKEAKSKDELAPGNGERVIVINSAVRGGVQVRELVTNGTSFSVTFDKELPKPFEPKSKQDSHLVYGIAPPPERDPVDPTKIDPNDKVTFPFNRVDYYIAPPSDSSHSNCATGTATLYRGQILQKRRFWSLPILDCVADLQAIFLLDTSNDGTMVPHNDISGFAAQDLREHLKEVRVYILAQQGKIDPGYRYPVADPNRAIVLGDPVHGRVWKETELSGTFGADWRQYHWKIFTISVQLRNLE